MNFTSALPTFPFTIVPPMSFFNEPFIKNNARKLAVLIDFPDTFLTDMGPFLYNNLNGKIVYEPFERLVAWSASSLFGSDLSTLRTWYHTSLIGKEQQNWAMGKDPVEPLFWLTFYVVMLFVLAFVGRFAAYPGRLEMKSFSMVHNIILTVLSFYMFVGQIVNMLAEPDVTNPFDLPAPTQNKPYAKTCWLFMLSKIPEFIDTFIMVLKQNYHQVSFLHVYHHTSILVFCIFFNSSVSIGGVGWVSGAMNALVHTFMYFYYAATSFAGKTGPLRDFLNSIKFIITKGQMTQFALNFVHAMYLNFVLGEDSKFPTFHCKIMMLYMLTMLGLFGNFLIQGQRAAARAKKEKMMMMNKNIKSKKLE